MRFVIVTGMSGAGKSNALHNLEDVGYYCVDNMPIPLTGPFARIAADGSAGEYNKIAVGIDIRSGLTKKTLEQALRDVKRAGIRYEILFLDASDDVLMRRFKETRRTHPLAGKAGSTEAGIKLERKCLSGLKERADYIIDTSRLLTRDLRREILKIFVKGQDFRNLYITVQSFGFKYGIPADSDLVMDVRFLPNPYYVETLRPLTGCDKPIVDFVMGQKQTQVFLEKFLDLLHFLIPNYIAEGKNQLVISIGCTGGRHRSVALANAVYEALSKDAAYGIRIEHRDIRQEDARYTD